METKRDELSLLEEELVRLSVKSSLVVPSSKPTLVYSLWTKRTYNMDSLCAQMKSLWKTKGKFDFQVTGQNLFPITFDKEEDLEMIMEGRPWLFRKQLIFFERISKPIEQRKLRLVLSPFWMKIGPYPPECDQNDLIQVIGSTFEDGFQSEVKEGVCHLKVILDVQKPMLRGLFVSIEVQENVWIPFKYEMLPTFCFGCGRLGHRVKECPNLSVEEIEKSEDELPYSLVL